MMASHDLPPITIATCDYNRLMFTAVMGRRRGDRNADFLLSELRRATLCHVDDLPDDVISTNCRVIYRIDGGPKKHADLLVHPEDMKWPGAELSVTTPLGIALLGLRIGDRMPYPLDEKSPEHEVMVEGVGWRFLYDMSWRDICIYGPFSDPGDGREQ
jgi:regulator of nucleoside diphosphate kinase